MGQFTGSNDFITGRKSPVVPAGVEHTSVRYTVAMATADLAINSIGQVGILPAGCVPVGLYVDGTDMDSGAAAQIFQVGIGNLALVDAAGVASADLKDTLMSTRARDGGAAWGSTTAVNTAFAQHIVGQPMLLVTPVDYDRSVIVKVTTAPTTAVAGTLGVTLVYRAA